METKDKTADRISNTILSKFQADVLDISNCRDQAAAPVMAGNHSGV